MNTDTTLPALHVASRHAAALKRWRACFYWAPMCALFLVGSPPRAEATPPELMTYQGFLVDANGDPLAASNPANYPVIFRIYNLPIGGNLRWSEQQIVTVDNGHFSVVLGEGSDVGAEPRPLLSEAIGGFGDQRYLSISPTIGSVTAEILPRLRLLPAPYAFEATSARYLARPGGSSVLSYANNRVEVIGDFAITGGNIIGNGDSLTGVAKLSGVNTFNGNQRINGLVGINIAPNTYPLSFENITGKKIALYRPSGRTYGFTVENNLLQIHSGGVGSEIAFGYHEPVSDQLVEAVRIRGDGRVGIGTTSPTGKLQVNGGVRARGGIPGGNGVNDNGYAFWGNNGDPDSGMFSSGPALLQFFADSHERMRINDDKIGIGTTTPGAMLDVAGDIRSASVTANSVTANVLMTAPIVSATATITAPIATFTTLNSTIINGAVVNGEKQPVSHTIAGNVGTYRDLKIDCSNLLGDADGGKFRLLLRNHVTKEVRTVTYEFYAENDTDNFAGSTRYGWSVNSYGTERGFRLGSGTNANRYDIATDWGWYWFRNFRSAPLSGAGDAVAENAANRYQFWLMVRPDITATIILYDN